MRVKVLRIAVGFVAGLLAATGATAAPASEQLAGSIGGWVTSTGGIPQMGANVLIYNSAERILQRVLSDETGSFVFDSLPPDVYSVRVSLSSFVPALKRNIIVQPGMRSLLSVSLSSVLSSVELVYSSTGNSAIMSEDWKWVLRSDSSTRPVLRILPKVDISDPNDRVNLSSSMFSGMRGALKVSAGDPGMAASYGSETDLGTAFALATSLVGGSRLEVSGNIGYATSSRAPSTSFQTSYRRDRADGAAGPEVRVTMRQLNLPTRVGTAFFTGQAEGAPPLRTLSAGYHDRTRLTDTLSVEYGFSIESVSFIDRLNYFSPFVRLSYSVNDSSSIDFGYNSGLPPAEFFPSNGQHEDEFQQDFVALSLFPRVSMRDGQARVQRSENMEAGYRTSIGSRTYSVAAYSEKVRNAAATMVAPSGSFTMSDLLPDLLSNSSVFNLGTYSGIGYMASVTQAVTDSVTVTGAVGSGNALTPEGRVLATREADEVRSILNHGRRYWLAMSIAAKSPRTKTQFATSYRWADGRSLNAGHTYLTQNLVLDTGWSIHIRQPIPLRAGLPGRLEITADMRNLLAEGYVPLMTADGRWVYLLHTPRGLRGGLNFIF